MRQLGGQGACRVGMGARPAVGTAAVPRESGMHAPWQAAVPTAGWMATRAEPGDTPPATLLHQARLQSFRPAASTLTRYASATRPL